MKVAQYEMFKRVGIHYYPDTTHFRNIDLQKWIPELKSLGLSWLVIQSPIERAIPESFISQLVKTDITPIIHFNLNYHTDFNAKSLGLLLESYSNWGVKYICIYDRPNMKFNWLTDFWIKNDIVESFLDKFLPLANQILSYNMVPIYPPLEPGGDYWDTTFLRNSIKSIVRRGFSNLLDSMVVGAYGWINQKPINWGAGGAEHWPGSIPYFTPPGQQNHIGFYIFDWYTEIMRAELGKAMPIIFLKISDNIKPAGDKQYSARSVIYQSKLYLNIIEMMIDSDNNPNDEIDIPNYAQNEYSLNNNHNVPDHVLCANFWLLTTSPQNKNSPQAWYKSNGTQLPIVNYLKNIHKKQAIKTNNLIPEAPSNYLTKYKNITSETSGSKQINHYFLIPPSLNVSDCWRNNVIRSFINQHHPTIGFSVTEACLAQQITIYGEPEKYNIETIKLLQQDMRKINMLNFDGTILAIQ